MKFFKTAILGAFLISTGIFAQFSQTPLPYSYKAFKKNIDAKTMEIHYSKHAAGYTSNLNKAIAGTALEKQSIEKILSQISSTSPAVRNNAGGHYNHELFWAILTPKKNTKISENLKHAIDKKFGSFDNFKKELNDAAAKRFGSGWAWLSVGADGELQISSTPNQDNPLMDIAEVKGLPILGIDVWEHAYYLKYQNKRADYLNNIWEIINWEEVSRRYDLAKKK